MCEVAVEVHGCLGIGRVGGCRGVTAHDVGPCGTALVQHTLVVGLRFGLGSGTMTRVIIKETRARVKVGSAPSNKHPLVHRTTLRRNKLKGCDQG